MPPRPARPRRSAPTSYAHLLQPLDLSSSSSGADDSDSDATKRAKRLKKKKISFIPSEDSASEFEEPPKASGAQAGDDDDDDDDEDLDVVVSGDDDVQSGQGDEDMSDIASIGGNDDPPSAGARATRRKARPPSSRKSRALANPHEHGYGTGAKAPRRSLVVTKGNVPAAGEQGQTPAEPARATTTRTIPSGLDTQYSSLVPHYLPPLVHLSTSNPSYSTASVETSRSRTRGQTDDDASTLLDRWTCNPFAPEKTLIRDVGWEQGKWKDDDGEAGIKEKWGGWYDEIQFDAEANQQADQADIEVRLPDQTFSGRPVPFHTLTASTSKPNATSDESELPDLTSATEEDTHVSQTQSASGAAASDDRRRFFAGAIKGVGEQEISLGRFESTPLNSFIPRKPGHILNVGGPVSGLAWLPRLTGPSTRGESRLRLSCSMFGLSTISSPLLTLSHPPNLTDSRSSSMVQIWSLSSPNPEESLAVETPSRDPEGDQGRTKEEQERMKFEMGILVAEGEGEARDLQWCPRGGSISGSNGSSERMDVDCDDDDNNNNDDDKDERLGVLAGVFTDGKVKIFVVPHPDKVRKQQGKSPHETVYVYATKVLELSVPNTSCLSFAWGSWETIAAGGLNGYIAVWCVGDALRKGLSSVRPTHYLSAHACAIRSIVFANIPPRATSRDALGSFDLDGEPRKIATVGYDGSTLLTDLRESDGAGSGVLLHERSSSYAVAWSAQSGCVYADDQDDRIRAYFLKSFDFGNSKRIGAHRGTIWSLAASDHHPFVLSASSDGTVLMHSGVRALRRRRVRGHFSQMLYSLEFERETGKWRMSDNFQVEHRTALDSLAIGSSTSSKTTGEPPLTSILAWPPEVQVNKVCWHPNLERSALVASGGTWGCVRVDWVEGVGAKGE
ncbi:hypothetical protein JCM11491_000646 [Sporobolomyces phaffii]